MKYHPYSSDEPGSDSDCPPKPGNVEDYAVNSEGSDDASELDEEEFLASGARYDSGHEDVGPRSLPGGWSSGAEGSDDDFITLSRQRGRQRSSLVIFPNNSDHLD